MSVTTTTIQPLTSSLERLLIFKEVFTQHIQTCEKIITGNCLARDTLLDLKNYLTKNLLHFNPFVQSLRGVSVPNGYEQEYNTILGAVTRYRNAIEDIIGAISHDGVDTIPFRMSVKQQRSALAWIDGAYIDTLRLQAGQFGQCSMVG